VGQGEQRVGEQRERSHQRVQSIIEQVLIYVGMYLDDNIGDVSLRAFNFPLSPDCGHHWLLVSPGSFLLFFIVLILFFKRTLFLALPCYHAGERVGSWHVLTC
jgi:hypothetical protein